MQRAAKALATCLSLALLLAPAIPASAAGTITLNPGAVTVGYGPTQIAIDTQADFGTTPPPVFLLNASSQPQAEVSGVQLLTPSDLEFTLEPGLAAGSYTVEVDLAGGTSLTQQLNVLTPSYTLSSQTPAIAGYTQAIQFSAAGTNTDFGSQTAVSLIDQSGATVSGAISGVVVQSPTALTFSLEPGVPAGSYEVAISGVPGQQPLTVQHSGVTFNPSPVAEGYSGLIQATGTNTEFSKGITVSFETASGAQMQVTNQTVQTATAMSFGLPTGLPAGTYTVVFQEGQQTVKQPFTVQAAPSFSFSPALLPSGYQPMPLSLTGVDTFFSSATTKVNLLGSSNASEDSYLASVQFQNGTQATVNLMKGLPAGTYTLQVAVSSYPTLSTTLTVSTSSSVSSGGTSSSGGSTGGSSGGSPSSGGGPTPPPSTSSSGTVNVTTATTQATQASTTLFTVNPQLLADALGSAQGQTAQIESASGDAALVLPSQSVQTLIQDKDQMEFSTPSASYNLPLQVLPMAQLAAALGTASGSDVSLEISVQPASSADQAALTHAFGVKDVLVSPVSFSVTASANGKTVPVGSLGGLAQSTLTLPSGTVAGSDTVGVVLVNGTPQHARTTISGNTVTFYSETVSTFAVVAHQTNFSDIAGLPQATAIQALSDQLVIDGFTSSLFEPQGGVTRAQFAAFMVRALGLWNIGGVNAKFSDVPSSYWAASVIQSAATEKFIDGFPSGKFEPGAQITNEQMAAIVARAMAYLGIGQGKETAQPKDASQIPSWAQSDVDLALSQGIMSVNAQGDFAPHAVTTRAQAAQIIWNLMQQAGIQ